MASASQYWSGAIRATLAAKDIDASKICAGPKGSHALGVMNNAFRIFHDARQLIAGVGDAALKKKMSAELDDVGRSGWGIGVSDLEEAFAHLAANQGKWKDNHTSTMGWFSSDRIGGISGQAQVGYVPIPISLENFLDALNARAKTLNVHLTALRTHGETVVNKAASSYGDQLLPKVGSAEWTAFGNGLKEVGRAQEAIKSLLWLAAVNEDSVLNASNENLGKVLGAIGKVRSAVENFDKCAQAGYSSTEGLAFAAIAEGLGAIPVLGSYYQEAFQLIPGVTAGMTHIVQRRNALAAKLGVDLRTTLD